jgi:hypothetical protein
MDQGICLLSIIPVRKDPSEKSEMVSQLLFGETYEISEKTSAWYKIITEFDQYTGWIDRKMFSPVTDDYYNRLIQGGVDVAGSITAKLLAPDRTVQTITAGSTIGYTLPDGTLEIDSLIYRVMEQTLESIIGLPLSLVETAKQFLNSPYLWGGRTPFGFDCSGFTQIVFKIRGQRLPRDASQQSVMGKSINKLLELREGDLAFFCNEENKVVHVGIALPPDKIIHCSGMVRMDKLDEKGIFNQQLGQYTHRLHSMRRVV